MKHCNSLTVVGCGHFKTACTLLSSMATLSGHITFEIHISLPCYTIGEKWDIAEWLGHAGHVLQTITHRISMSLKKSLMKGWITDGLLTSPNVLIVPCVGWECCLPFISFADVNEVVCTAQIEFAEVFGHSELFQGCRNQRQDHFTVISFRPW